MAHGRRRRVIVLGPDGEAKWNHLRERPDAVGLAAGELVAEVIGENGLITRQREGIPAERALAGHDTGDAQPTIAALQDRAQCSWWAETARLPETGDGAGTLAESCDDSYGLAELFHWSLTIHPHRLSMAATGRVNSLSRPGR
jgi:hypothetical protein